MNEWMMDSRGRGGNGQELMNNEGYKEGDGQEGVPRPAFWAGPATAQPRPAALTPFSIQPGLGRQ